MKSKRIQILLVVVTVLSLGAGLTAGFLTARLPAASTPPTMPPLDRTPLVEELQLSAEQRDQMRVIWENVREKTHDVFLDAQQLQKSREDALVGLLNPEQRARFAEISQNFARRFDELTRTRDQAFDQAVKQSKALMNDIQQKKYDQILRDHVGTAGNYGPALGPTTAN